MNEFIDLIKEIILIHIENWLIPFLIVILVVIYEWLKNKWFNKKR